MYLLSAKDLMSERLEALANQGYELQPREDHVIKFSAENVALQQAIEERAPRLKPRPAHLEISTVIAKVTIRRFS